jgi:hypothetical protein
VNIFRVVGNVMVKGRMSDWGYLNFVHVIFLQKFFNLSSRRIFGEILQLNEVLELFFLQKEISVLEIFPLDEFSQIFVTE